MSKQYKAISLTVDILLFVQDNNIAQVLLIKRLNEPYKDKWAIPGGFVEYDEDLDIAAMRELEEETGISGVKLNQLYTVGTPGRDPRGRTVSIVYYTCIKGQCPPVKAGDDAKEAQWFDLKALPELAFDHKAIIEYAVEKCLKQ